jgi:adenylate cyclase
LFKPRETSPLSIQLSTLASQVDEILNQLRKSNPNGPLVDKLTQLSILLGLYKRQMTENEEELRSLRALAGIGEVINSFLDLETALRIVMDTIIRLVVAERGFLMLPDEQGELTIRVARNWEQLRVSPADFAISGTVISQVAKDFKPFLTTNAQQDPRFDRQDSIVAYNLRSILCVPMLVKGNLVGVIYVDNRIRSGIFTQTEVSLLTAFANQAGVAIENARLFAHVQRTLKEVTELKNLTDNIFYSVANGVLMIDSEDKIRLCNRAAEEILGTTSAEMVGSPLEKIFPMAGSVLSPHIAEVHRTNQPMLRLELSLTLPRRGAIDLLINLTPLKDLQGTSQGITIVIDDITAMKRLEAQSRLFERMVAPAVIQQINPDSIHLGGQRSDITTIFADIRGFTTFSENMALAPELLVSILNSYLAIAVEAILAEGGTIDKFLGDAVMAWFNAPVSQVDHSLRAVRAAMSISHAIEKLHASVPPDYRLSFAVGIHCGDAVLGLVGAEKRMEYTAIGDSVNTAKRIQEYAASGQILISAEVYEKVREQVIARPVEPFQAKGKRELIDVYEVVSLK